jgi:hypothetical protein
MHTLHETHPVDIDEEGALAANRLGDQRLLAGRVVPEEEHRGVELDELHVGHDRPGPQGDRHAVSGRHRRVGRRGVDLAEAARREDDGAGLRGTDPVDLPLADDVDRRPAHPPSGVLEQVDDEGVLDDLDARVIRDAVQGLDEGPRDLLAGRIATGVQDAVTMVAAFPGQADRPVAPPVELRTESNQFADPSRPFVDQSCHSGDVAQPHACDERVMQVVAWGVVVGQRGRDTALGPRGGPLGEQGLGDQQHRGTTCAQSQCRGETRDPRPDDDDVGRRRPPRRGRPQPARDVDRRH